MTNDDAIEILKNIQDNLEETMFLDRCSIDMAIEALKNQRPHGKWKCEYSRAYCSECNDFIVGFILPDFCPNCGADMRGDE